MEKIFEKATRSHLRFPFKGQITVEDLWDLKPEDLNTIAKTLNKKLHEFDEEEDFLVANKKNPEASKLELGLEVLKYIIKTKITEKEESEKRLQNRRKAAVLQELQDAEEFEELKKMSKEERQKAIDELMNS